MKISLYSFVMLFALAGALKAENPREIKVLMQQREKAISKVNVTAAQKLEKLKAVYMKRGDLYAANKANELKELVSSGKVAAFKKVNGIEENVVGKKWEWRHKGDRKSWLILKADGTAQVSFKGKKVLRWIQFEDRTIGLYFPKESRTAILSWEPDFKSYKGIERNFKVKLRGREVK